jgi:ankyrin repeat protein
VSKRCANPEGDGSKSLLFAAIELDGPAIADVWLEAGASVVAVDEKGRNVLMIAARSGRHEMVITLIPRGADVNLRDADGGNILHYLAADKEP